MSAASPTFRANELVAAVCRGVAEGNKDLIAALNGTSSKRHELRDMVQTVVDKNYALDTEVKLLKGWMVTLVGDGSGSSGMVPRMEKDINEMKESVSRLSSDVRTMGADLRRLADNTDKNNEFRWGWKGVATAIGIITALIGVLVFFLGKGHL